MRISIVTICYNPGAVIRSALESVSNQSHEDLEHIVVDGGSTDGTVDLLAGFESRVASFRWVSEPDEGLYDALNKGVRLATGDVVGFVHADDFLASPEVLSRVASAFEQSGADAVYGDLQYVSGSERDFRVIRHWASGSYERKKLRWGWMPPHPSLYLRKSVYERAALADGSFFDTSFSCAADYDFMMRVLSAYGVQPVYVPEVLIRMRVGGVSNRSLKHMVRKSLEDWRAIRRNRIGHIDTLIWKNLGKLGQFVTGGARGGS